MNTFFDLFLKDKCIICNKISKKYGYCYEHYDTNNIKNIVDNMMKNICESNIDDLYDNIKNIKCEIKHQMININEKIKYYMNQFQPKISIKQKYIGNIICDEFKNELMYTNMHVDYKNILKFIKNIKLDKWNELNVNDENKHLTEILNVRKIMLQKKLLTYDMLLIDNINLFKKNVTTNNDILINALINLNNIIYITNEKSENINNHLLRYDIYFILLTKNHDLFEVYIELDESVHTSYKLNSKEYKYDVYKDIYCLINGKSFVRYYQKTKKMNNNDINNIIDIINDIINTNMPKWYIYDKYIEHKQMKNCINLDIDL